MAKIIKALWDLSEKLGVTTKKDTIEEQVNAINNAIGVKMGNNIEEGLRYYVTDAPEKDITDLDPTSVVTPTVETVYEHNVSDLQENIEITNGKITGTLKYTDEGALPSYWGAGYFIVLKFADFPTGTTACYAGVSPSMGSGAGDVFEDSDHTLVAKITDRKTQRLKVTTIAGDIFRTQYFDLSGLDIEGYTPTEE